MLRFTASDAIAALALVLSIVATVTTIRFNSRQKSLIESQERLNRRLLEREDAESANAKRADVSASLIRIGENWKVKVYNKGQAPARNVTVKTEDGSDLLIQGDIDSKFPLEVLEPQHGVELIALVHLGSRSKQALALSWSDDYRETNEKTSYVTI